MNIPITQSREWQKLQEDLKETSFFEKTDDFQYLAILKTTPVGSYLYCPYGPVATDKTNLKKALKSLKNLATEHKAIFIRVEPQLQLTGEALSSLVKPLNLAAIKSKDLSPADTWVLDLTPDQPTLISHFSQGTRTRYNTYAKKGLVVSQTRDTADIKHLVALQGLLFAKKHITPYDENYLKSELEQPFATLYLVKYQVATDSNSTQNSTTPPKDGQILAASLFFDYQDTRYYMQSAADYRYKNLPATVALLTSAIFDAKEKGIKRFDFWGIAPDGSPKDHPWAGFTEFKKSFGGDAVHYTGTYDLAINPIKYKFYQLTRSLRRTISGHQ